MTFLEKLREDNPNMKLAKGDFPSFCPYEIGLIEEECGGMKCKDCWNREMPNTEQKNELVRDFDCELDMAYDRGFNDAWELVNKLHAMTSSNLVRAYGFSKPEYVFNEFTYEEALAKLKAYEEAQIEVGDVVTYSGEKGMVLDSIPSKFVVLTHDGWIQEWYECDVEKTGKHIELDGLLEQIGE